MKILEKKLETLLIFFSGSDIFFKDLISPDLFLSVVCRQ